MAPQDYLVTTGYQGRGIVQPGIATVPAGGQVTISACPADGWEFSAWVGQDVIGTTNPLVIKRVRWNLNVVALFVKLKPVTLRDRLLFRLGLQRIKKGD